MELRAEQGARQKVEREWAAAERVARTEGTAKELALGRVAQLEREVESVKGYLKEEKKVGEERVRVVREKLEGALKEEKAANAAKLAEAEQRLEERLTEEKEKLEKELKEEMDKVKKEAEENGDEAVWVEQVRELKAELKARQDDVMMLEEDKVKAAEAAKKEKGASFSAFFPSESRTDPLPLPPRRGPPSRAIDSSSSQPATSRQRRVPRRQDQEAQG